VRCVCGHESDDPFYDGEKFNYTTAFRSIGTTARIEEVSTVGYYRLHVKPQTELFVCPKCGTVRVG